MKSGLLTFLFLLGSISALWATHNRAGEITWRYIGNNRIEMTIATYTKFCDDAVLADRDSLQVNWGDGTPMQWVRRVNGPIGPNGIPQGELINTCFKINYYIAEHTYPGTGHYRISMRDPNREAGICNVNDPNSVSVPFFIQTTVTILNEVAGVQNAPVLQNFPIVNACLGEVFKHNPIAFDPDGDSLAFRLIVPLESENDPVPLYEDPQTIEPGPDNILTIDEVTGDIVWDAPQKVCKYNIAILIIDYRNGQPLDSVIRDMQIIVEECDNQPPEVNTVDEICVVAGQLIEFEVIGTDPDVNPAQQVRLTAAGAPFTLDISPAEFIVPTGFQDQPVEGTFRWQTTCEHISDQEYFIGFTAEDDYRITDPEPKNLADIKTVRIKVVGPPPEDVQAEVENQVVRISWELPYSCEDAADNYFRGFSVWRREGSNPFVVDSCDPGLAGRGYTRIERFYNGNDGQRYVYEDFEVERGRTYCYRILAEFAQETTGSVVQIFNLVEGLPSEEICIQLGRDVPLLTNVDVLETDAADGQILVRWTRPLAEDLDTLQNPGPYRFELLRAEGFATGGFAPVPGAVFTSPAFSGLTDTVFIDSTGLNTQENPYTYKIDFFVQSDQLIDNNSTASSIFLSTTPADNTSNLSWQEETPWSNFAYVVFRELPDGSAFEVLDTVETTSYADRDLINGQEYCYYIEGLGSYGVDDLPSPLLNKSQIACETPQDLTPPCPPTLEVLNDCGEADNFTPEEDFFNTLIWTNPNVICDDTDDVVGYRLYYAPDSNATFEQFAQIDDPEDLVEDHKPQEGIGGCYAVTAIDSFLNESAFSNIVCVENCPFYQLPNVFTPNEDGSNDLFVPFPYRFVDRVELQVFNRWGNLVFETEDPDVNWDGKDLSGNELTEGTYFYVCKIFEEKDNGSVPLDTILKGYIELIRGQ